MTYLELLEKLADIGEKNPSILHKDIAVDGEDCILRGVEDVEVNQEVDDTVAISFQC